MFSAETRECGSDGWRKEKRDDRSLFMQARFKPQGSIGRPVVDVDPGDTAATPVVVAGGTAFMRAYPGCACRYRQGVYPGIGSAGSMDHEFASIQQRGDPDQLALDRAQAVLYLPAMKVRAVILDQQFIVHFTIIRGWLCGVSEMTLAGFLSCC